eukprot:CCRYP_001421-RD/>CCRYP_001421-RD protein AED:0.04 eAED:0.04 QI:866/1/1/1/1/1/4/231/475
MNPSSLKDSLGKLVSLRNLILTLDITLIPRSLLSKSLATEECAATKTSWAVTDMTIGHRGGATMQMPEHTIENYKAGAMMGAGVIECDVTFTSDLELVCRHSQCDLHTTTDVVLHDELNAKCTIPWEAGNEPKCCTSDFTLEELKGLCAKMDSSGGTSATTAMEYVYGGTADWRTDLYQYPCPEVVTHKEYIKLVQSLGRKFTPELKTPSVDMPFNGMTQEDYAQKMIDEYIELGVAPEDLYPQSFLPSDTYYWVANSGEYGAQSVALDETDRNETAARAFHDELIANGVKIVAPAQQMLVRPAEEGEDSELGIVPSVYAESAIDHNLDIITWTLERSPPGLKVGDPPGLTIDDLWYWSSLQSLNLTDGSNFELLHVLIHDIGVIGVFTDWAPTVTFYANCMGVGFNASSEAAKDDSISDGSSATVDISNIAEDLKNVSSDSVEVKSTDSSSSGAARALRVAARLASIVVRAAGF